ncbi:1-deoxy-D-xylulose-5-phosphate reductoisomerase [Paracoccus methylarcula]|uniref:1-deoxy-D-xylulose 5-phosphate reductoisomerase n=1 Tax=Paracoccus methylarcula TaxID=72022 RepID=A0A422QV48_9RHOB|nr:1-deoxy-D-xylulose-5-phosphate reductoisomerase [Paracoccus methylarcula]RNF33761.1 1-deoxy-D-xylulose-5-phosphate reductoisomerase [Paracoccus methylarcula]
MRRISIFGATGSVGTNGIDLIRRAGGAEAFHVVALTAGRNIERLASSAREMRAEIAVTAHEELLDDLRARLEGSGVEAAAGPAALVEAAARPADWVLSAIVGAAGLAPGLTALAQGGVLALANKESLVCAGPLMRAAADRNGTKILPVDSEHSAIFQALGSESRDSVKHVTITASGGAFRDWPLERLAAATVAEASTHPNWAMGQRITIDSASMFNKAMEVIETHEFFDLEAERIKVLLHPESIIHAMVTHVDGGTIAHLGAPDMRHAIGYALNWPERAPLPVAALDLAKTGSLTFREPDETRWPALRLAREVMAAGGMAGAVFNAAKEQALDDFIANRIGFVQMAPRVEAVLETLSGQAGFADPPADLDMVLHWDRIARQEAAA